MTVNGKEFELVFKFKSDMIYEKIQGKSFTPDQETNWLVYFYSTYLALTGDEELLFDDFVLEMDKEPVKLYIFIKWYTTMYEQMMSVVKKELEQEEEQPKRKRTKKAKTL